MVSVLSGLGGLPRSWPLDGRGGGFPSSFRTWRSPLAADPALSLRTGFVSHFFRVLTERLEPGELGAELPDGCGGSEATEVEMLPSLPAAEYESGENTERERGIRNQADNCWIIVKCATGQSSLFAFRAQLINELAYVVKVRKQNLI